jgi:hypothetical protein
MLNDEKSLIRQFAEALIPLGLGLFDSPLAVAPKLKEMFADYVSLPSGAKDLSRFIEDAGAHISEWQTCYLQYTAKRTTLESVGSLGSGRPSSHGLMHDKRQKTVFKMNNKPSKHSPLVAVSGNDAIDITAFLIEKRGFSASYLSRIGSVILTELKGLQDPTDEQINKEAQKLLLLLETFPLVLFTDRANQRLLATGNPAPTNLEVMRLTIPEMCLFIVEHDRKHFPATHG